MPELSLSDTPPPPARAPARITPMMAQYFSVREKAGDALLFYRMGDFYELFFDDAVTAAGVLDIALTRRGQHAGQDVPMCGVPFHSYETYLARLIRAGFKVAICEQTETPQEARKRGPKAVVTREIVRIVTQGTIIEDALLDAGTDNYLAALLPACGDTPPALAWTDISTGALSVCTLKEDTPDAVLATVSPAELVFPETGKNAHEAAVYEKIRRELNVTCRPVQQFTPETGSRRLRELLGVASVEGFGSFPAQELAALGALLSYVETTQAGRMPVLSPPRRIRPDGMMAIDPVTRISLELLESRDGRKKGSLCRAVDRTVTGAGARMLARRIASPLTDRQEITNRLDAVGYFAEKPDILEKIRARLKETPDMARSLSRLSCGRGGPRDMAAIRDGLDRARAIARILSADAGDPCRHVRENLHALEDRTGNGFSVLLKELRRALGDRLPLLARDGGFIAKGYDPGLDAARAARDESRRVIAGLESRYRTLTDIKTLRIKHNNVLGYFVETAPSHGDRLTSPPFDATFIHRQTLTGSVRFTTAELSELAASIARSADEALAREEILYDRLCEMILARHDTISPAALALAAVDTGTALALLAREEKHVRPDITDGRHFEIRGGRHPVVEKSLEKGNGNAFVANDCTLGDETQTSLWLMTGPNMAGKSTFLRQNALIAILAQAGCYVPATSARIGIVDRVFSRVGASDDLSRGHSTFMVEMIETAAILNQATDRSLVVLDEIGRGTSTFDGLSIAWAAVEHLHDINRSRGLFATHYHELTELSERLPRLTGMSMKVREWKGEVVFLHEVAQGPANRSYGIAVARLAGLPARTVSRAREVLKMLESRRDSACGPLFAHAEEPAGNAGQNADGHERLRHLAEELEELDPDCLSPREALDALYRLKKSLAETAGP